MILLGKHPRVEYEAIRSILSFVIVDITGRESFIGNKQFYSTIFKAIDVPAIYEFDEESHNNVQGYKLISINALGDKVGWIMKSKVFSYIANRNETN